MKTWLTYGLIVGGFAAAYVVTGGPLLGVAAVVTGIIGAFTVLAAGYVRDTANDPREIPNHPEHTTEDVRDN